MVMVRRKAFEREPVLSYSNSLGTFPEKVIPLMFKHPNLYFKFTGKHVTNWRGKHYFNITIIARDKHG